MSRVYRSPPPLPSPVRIFPALLAIFLAEALILYLVPHFLPHPHSLTGALLIAALLILCITPPLWWLLIRPLQSTVLVEYSRGATVVAHAVDGIITVDLEGLVEAFNPAAERIFGYRAEEMMGRPVTLLMPERYHEAHQGGLERVKSGGDPRIIGKTVEMTGLRKDGREFPLELSLTRWQAGDRTLCTGIVRDITERKQAEQQLRLHSTAMESAANAIVITDRDGRITWVNPAFTRLAGYTAEEVLGRNPRVLKSGNHDQAFYHNVWETILSGQVWQREMTNRRKDGSLITEEQTITPVRDATGEITHFVSINHDLTERRRVEEEIKVLARFPSENPNPVLRLNQDGQILYANEASEPLMRDWGNGVGGPASTPWREIVRDALITRSSRVIDVQCGEKVYSFFVAPIRDAGYVNLYGRDITEPKRMEETHQALYRASLQIQEQMGLQDRLHRLLETARNILHLDRFIVLLADRGAQWLEAVASTGTDEPLEAIRVPIGPEGGGLARAYLSGQGVVWDGLAPVPEDLRLKPPYDRVRAFRSRVFAIVPLVVEGRAIGVLGVDRKHSRLPLEPATLELLQLFAGQAAIAIENARLFAATELRAAELQTLRSIDQAITGRLELTDVLEAVVAGALELLGTQHTQITLWDEATQTLRLGAAVGTEAERVRTQQFELGKGVNGTVALTHQPMVLDDYQASPYALPESRDVIATISVPILFEDRLLGVLHSHTTTPGKRFTADDLHRLQTLARQAAIAIENARLYTELRQSYQDLRQAQGELVRTEKLRALGQMAAGIAHDLNNMLAAILGQVELLRLQVQEPVVQHALALLTTATTDGAEVVRRLQGFARQEPSGILVPCDLATLAVDAVDLTRPRWKDDPQRQGYVITLQTALLSLPPILGNPSELREALLNLILNAVDAMPQGGTLTLSGQVTPAGVELTVMDTGVGMPPEIRQRIFDPFFTTKAEKGTGLGLSMVYGILERHGGHISVDSTPGKGSTFTLRFPPAPGTLPPPAAPPHLGPPRRLLLIDDDPLVRQTLARLLRTAGHMVLVAAGGPAGLACLAAEPVDLVLTDLGMPDMNGMEVARAVKAQAPHLPVLLLTGWGDEEAAEVVQAGLVDRVLGKPFRLQEVLDTIAELIGGKPSALPAIHPPGSIV